MDVTTLNVITSPSKAVTISYIMTALAACALVVVTIIMIWKQIRNNRMVSGVSLIMQMARRYATEYRDVRSRVAKNFRRKRKRVLNQEDYFLLNFFETLGYLVRRGMVDKEMIWIEFSIKIQGWWSVYAKNIKNLRIEDEDETLYEEFEYLYNEMLDLEIERRLISKKQATFSKDKIEQFLKSELKF